MMLDYEKFIGGKIIFVKIMWSTEQYYTIILFVTMKQVSYPFENQIVNCLLVLFLMAEIHFYLFF